MYQVNQEILEVAKALGEETRFSIFRRIADSPQPLTVKDLVARLGMHHSAIRIHLNRLEEAGLIVSRKQHKKGAVGRPQLAFLPSPRALSITLPPRNYQFLARLTMDLLAANGTGRAPREFCYEWGRSYMRDRGRLPEGRQPLTKAVRTLLKELHELGSNATAVAVDGGYELTEGNCLFGEIAPDYDGTVCDLHQAVMRGMLAELSAQEFTWEQDSRIAAGDPVCTMRIRPTEA